MALIQCLLIHLHLYHASLFVVVVVQLLNPFHLFSNTLDCSLSGSSVYRISQARILGWVVIFFSRDLPDSGIRLAFLHCRWFFTAEPPGKFYSLLNTYIWTQGFPDSSAGKESACNMGDLGLIPGLGKSCREGKGYPLQYSGLENSMDCIVHRVAKSRMRLSDFHFHIWTHLITAVYCWCW